MAPKTGSFCTSVLRTRDVRRAVAYYNAVFGWKTALEPGTSDHWFFQFNGKTVASVHQISEGPDLWVPHVLVENIDGSMEQAWSLGATMVDSSQVPGVARLVALRDLEGATFGLWQAQPHQGAEITEGVGSIWWIEILSKDVARSRDFYGRLFGWEFRETAFEPFASYTVFTRGRDQEGGLLPIDPEWGEVSPAWSTIFAVDDGDRTIERAKSFGGCEIFTHTVPKAGRIGGLIDPGGASFTIRGPVPE
jgi:predicted enzyme related to lactoylglutathione lyase